MVEDPKKDFVMDMYVAEEQTTTESKTATQAPSGNGDKKEAVPAPCLGLELVFIPSLPFERRFWSAGGREIR